MSNFSASTDVTLNELLHNIGDAICLSDNDMNFVAANQKLADFYGKKPEDLIGKNVFEFYPDFKNSVFFEASQHTLKTGEPATRIGFSNNLKKWIVVRTFKYDENHGVLYVHELKNGFDKHCYIRNYDNLTSLYNRFTFEADLDQNCQLKKSFATVIIDINKFKQINESFSFIVGDMCLMEVAARIKQSMPKRKIYRIGADQFAAIIIDDKKVVKEEIDNCINTFKIPFKLDKESYSLTCSIGYTYVTNNDNNIASIINQVEFALSRAKKFNNLAIEHDDSITDLKEKIQCAKHLKQAFLNNELEIFYQPQIDTITHKTCGAEALIRWNHPEKGIIPPIEFLSIAEEYNLLEEIDRWVLEHATKDIVEFQNQGLAIPISVNFSAKTICSDHTIPLVLECLKKTKINPKMLTVEITETNLMEDINKSKVTIAKLAELGILTALDDFGTGYSSMGYLMKYPTNYLKIDKEFITDIDKKNTLKIMTHNLIKLGHSLSMTVIAEGVENQSELTILKNFNCDIIQGYFFSKPLCKKDFLNFVNKNGFSNLKAQYF